MQYASNNAITLTLPFYWQNGLAVERKEELSISWHIMINHDVPRHYCYTNQKHNFCRESVQSQHFCSKNYDYAFIDSFWGSTGFIDSAASYATLASKFELNICFLILGWEDIFNRKNRHEVTALSHYWDWKDLFSFIFIGPEPDHCLALWKTNRILCYKVMINAQLLLKKIKFLLMFLSCSLCL